MANKYNVVLESAWNDETRYCGFKIFNHMNTKLLATGVYDSKVDESRVHILTFDDVKGHEFFHQVWESPVVLYPMETKQQLHDKLNEVFNNE